MVSAGFADDDVVLSRHAAAIEAAEKAGVRHVVYTSLAGSGEHLTIALAHRWTEGRLAEASFDSTVLRNGLYAEIPAGLAMAAVPSASESGLFTAPLGRGTFPVVAREDLADVAAKVTAEIQIAVAEGRRSAHAGRTYELDGPSSVGGPDLAAALSEALRREVRYESSPLGDTWAALASVGLAPYQIAHTVSMFSNINAGLLAPIPTDLPSLLATAPRPVHALLVEAARAATVRSPTLNV